MRRILIGAIAAGLVLGLAPFARAQDEAKAIIEKAIKASGGADKLNKIKATQAKSKGTLEIMGLSLAFTSENFVQDGRFKEVMVMDVMGQKVTQTVGFDGKTAWILANGMDFPVTDDMQAEMKEKSFQMEANQLPKLLDKSHELSLLGEAKVNDRPAVGVKVAIKGHRDSSLYFDKETGLLAKTESRTKDFMSGQEVTEERIITEYQDLDGMKTAKKMTVNRDGKKLLDLELTEVKHVDKIDDSEFKKP